jgi:hypothetical protein
MAEHMLSAAFVAMLLAGCARQPTDPIIFDPSDCHVTNTGQTRTRTTMQPMVIGKIIIEQPLIHHDELYSVQCEREEWH